MKKQLLLLSILFWCAGTLFISCKKTDDVTHYTFYRPIFKSKTEVRAAIKSGSAQSISSAGKIFIKDDYLFLVDVNKGVHIISISNINRPVKVAFIPIPGCADIAVRGNFLYADCDKDLVTIDISNPAAATLKKVISNVFPEKYYYSIYGYAYTPDTTKMVAGWTRVDTTVIKDKNPPSNIFINVAASSFSTSSATTTNGVGGSTSRFGLLNDRMYAVSNFDLKVFNTADASNPTFVKKTTLTQGNIETIFPYKNNLFIGSQNGMYIYDASNPDNPAKLTQFTHVRSCDPVIADENTAYVTLHGGSACGGFSNQMDVLDISSLTNPVFVKTYALTSPRGLAKDGKILLICDGTDGLKFFNAADATN
ncbi:MAG: hypothetical protein EOP42_30350, partial [Sphingobacteriaceae bacterium]